MATENKRLNVNPILWSTADTTYVIAEGEIWYYKRDSGIIFYLIGDGVSTVEQIEDAGLSEYTVVEQYTIGDQTVTKWSNGDMEIRYSVLYSSLAIATADGNVFRSAGQTPEDYVETFIGSIYVATCMKGNTAIWMKSFSDTASRPGLFHAITTTAVTTDSTYTCISKGQWT